MPSSSRQYSFLDCLGPENMIVENKNIPLFVFKYFLQKDMSDLIDETLEKTFFFLMA